MAAKKSTDRSVVYGLHSGDGLIWYVGQTKQLLSQRMASHRHKAKRGTCSPQLAARILDSGSNLAAEVLYRGGDLDAQERALITQLEPEVNRRIGGNSGGKMMPGNWTLGGEGNPAAKLTEDRVKKIREIYATGSVTQAGIATLYGISQTHVSDIVNRKVWKA